MRNIKSGLLAQVGITAIRHLLVPAIKKAVAVGDSITAYSPTNGGFDSYARLWKSGQPDVDYTISAVGGSTLGYPGDAPGTNSLYARLADNLALNPTHVSVFIGANDMDADSQAYANRLFTFTDNFRNQGAKVLVGTILPRDGVSNWNANRASLNTLIRGAVGSRITDVFDFGGDPVMGADDSFNDVTLYVDKLHPTALGQSKLLRIYQVPWNYALGISNQVFDFAFAPSAAATPETDYTSAAYKVNGLHAGESLSYSVQAGQYVSKNGGAFVLNGTGTVIQGDTLRLRLRSATGAATQIDAVLTIGTQVATYSVTTAGAGSRDWVPSDLGAKLAMWQTPESLGNDGSAVNSWEDQGANNNDLVVETSGGGGRPSVVSNAINGLKAVRFDPGEQAWLKPPANLLTGRTSLATFFISRNTRDPNTTNFGAPLGSWGTENGDYWVYSGGGIYSGYGTNVRRDNMDAPGTTTDWHQFMQLSAPGDWRISQDGADFGTFTSNTVSVNPNPKVGSSPGIGDFFDGYIAEIVDMNVAPTTTERQLIEGYLAWKFGLEANLPGTHPYKSARPTI